MISCQVCWRTTRWHNGQIRRSRNPYPSQVFQECSSKWEESVAHSIVARIHLRSIEPYETTVEQLRMAKLLPNYSRPWIETTLSGDGRASKRSEQ